jgi:hypothetical protein
MSLPAPNLDDRTFDQLVAEARARIPRFTPEWTNFNDADPGMTLVKLHAWLTETILYRLNKLPDLTYIKFLELLHVEPRPAVAASAQLTFTLKKLNKPTDPLAVLIAKNTQVGVDDPDLTSEVIFETDRTLTALNGILAAVIAPVLPEDPNKSHLQLVTEYNADKVEVKTPLPFFPFGQAPQAGACCLLGLLLRPHRQKNQDYSLDRFPAGELDLTALVPSVFEQDATGAILSGPQALDCLFPWQVAVQGETIVWEAYTGITHSQDFTNDHFWQKLPAIDETGGLNRSGHVYLDVPGGLPPVAFMALSRDFWLELGLNKPPTNAAELASDLLGTEGITLDPTELEKADWEQLGLTGDVLEDFCNKINDPTTLPATIAAVITDNAASLNFATFDQNIWLATSAGYDAPPVPHALTWFRARLVTPPAEPPQISQFLINTVAATAAVTRTEEALGISDGRPNQRFTLRRSPVLVLADASTGQLKPQLDLVVTELDQDEAWTSVDDFFGIGPDQAVYQLDVATGTVTFGDGVHGRIPVAGAQIKAQRYRSGGSALANAGPGTIKTLKSALPLVDSVTNIRAAAGGADAEPLDETLLRAPHDLRMRDRAVTAQDFAELALQTPGVRIQRAYALAMTSVEPGTTPPVLRPDSPGAVTVVILPEDKQETPQPSEDQLCLVCAHLNSRRLITTELYVVGPRYLTLDELTAEVLVSRQMDLKAVGNALTQALLDYFHPLHGGEDGRGWPFGQDIYFGQVYRQILNVAGVTRVLCLRISPANASDLCNDVITVNDGELVHLPADAIQLKVTYDPIH